METVSTRIPTQPTVIRGAAEWPGFAGGAPGNLGERGCGEPVTNHRSSWVRLIRIGSDTFYIKTYDYPTFSSRWRGALRNTGPWNRSRAAREYDALVWMLEHDFVAPRPLAVVEWRVGGLLRRAVLITAEFLGSPVDRLLRSLGDRDRETLAQAVGKLVHDLHRAGFRDRNLDARNLIADRDAAGRWVLAKIDSPRHRLHRPGDRVDRWVRADWARLLPQLAPFGVADVARAAT